MKKMTNLFLCFPYQNMVVIDGIEYIPDPSNPSVPFEDEVFGQQIPVSKAILLDSKLYNLDDIYKWIYGPLASKTVPHSRRELSSQEIQEIDTRFEATNPSSISEEVKDKLIKILTREYNFDNREFDMGENQATAVRIMQDMEKIRKNIIHQYPALKSPNTINKILTYHKHLQNHFARWIQTLE